MQGALESDDMATPQEKPAHPVAVDGFFMDKTEVTNAEFKKFVAETGYVTIAEREIDWEEIVLASGSLPVWRIPPILPRNILVFGL